MASPPQGENTGDGDYESVTTEDVDINSDGSETDPALEMNDEDTGLYRSGTDEIAVTTNGSQMAAFTSNGVFDISPSASGSPIQGNSGQFNLGGSNFGIEALSGTLAFINSSGNVAAKCPGGGGFIIQTSPVSYVVEDVRNISSPLRGDTAYHDGSGSNTEGPAHYDGTDWISTVDGSTIA